ncbi:hypothetical protein D3C76_1640040 [compost metagenome]
MHVYIVQIANLRQTNKYAAVHRADVVRQEGGFGFSLKRADLIVGEGLDACRLVNPVFEALEIFFAKKVRGVCKSTRECISSGNDGFATGV